MIRLRYALAAFGLAALLAAGFWAWVVSATLPALTPDTSVTVVDRNGVLLRAYPVADGRWRLPVAYEDVDPLYFAMLLAYEDKRFDSHYGVDPQALARGLWQFISNGRIVSGGSTLTMQVARLLEDGATGEWGAKLRQIRLALALERRLTKQEVLTLYLQLAPMGGNIEGLRAATLAYFAHEPNRLSPAEAALLIALPQAPTSRRPDRFNQAATIARNRVLDRAVSAGVLTTDDAAAARATPVPSLRRDFPALAPHLADALAEGAAPGTVIPTTLDAGLQASLQSLLAARAADFGARATAAALVADHASGEIRAYLGSSDFFSDQRRGAIDMVRAIRSPGSTLKPLIFGMAFEGGYAHPETMIDDRPMAFGSYAPRNFDGGFQGQVSLRRALQLSLNIPAVALLDVVGPAHLMARLRRAGVQARLPRNAAPDLPIALGGLGVSLHDLVALYAALAQGGLPVNLHATPGPAARGPLAPVLLAAAAWQVGDILIGTPPPAEAPLGTNAFKTGTSYGYRDAWALGYDGQHVAGIWVGRADAAAVPGLRGLDAAAPLLFDVFARLRTTPAPLPPPPENVLTVSNAQLPLPLRNFTPRGVPLRDAAAPEFSYPPDGARVDLGLGSHAPMPLILKLRSGRPPFTWLVNDRPIAADPYDWQASWQPDTGGFVTVSVIDAQGRATRVRLFLQ
ncbi:MAG: penicillin-binding protein 1C [Paracoccaceae bacterium]